MQQKAIIDSSRDARGAAPRASLAPARARARGRRGPPRSPLPLGPPVSSRAPLLFSRRLGATCCAHRGSDPRTLHLCPWLPCALASCPAVGVAGHPPPTRSPRLAGTLGSALSSSSSGFHPRFINKLSSRTWRKKKPGDPVCSSSSHPTPGVLPGGPPASSPPGRGRPAVLPGLGLWHGRSLP